MHHRSRCAKFRFLALGKTAVMARLQFIAEKEHVVLHGDTCRALADVSGGDMRKAVTYLQNAVHLHGATPLTSAIVYDVAGTVPPQVLHSFWTVCETRRAHFSHACASTCLHC